MKAYIGIMALVAILLTSTSFTISENNKGPWQKLGSKKVSYKLDRDILRVGPNDGTFKRLKVVVTGGSINMHKMVVEYGNGSKDKIPMKHTFTKGNDSRIIDLEGRNRIIKDITFWYDTKNFSQSRATVHVFGEK